MRTVFAALLLAAAASAAGAEDRWNVKTLVLEGAPDATGRIVMHWGGEIVNDTPEAATLHAVLELKGAKGVRLKQFETSAVNVRGYGEQRIENFFLVPPNVWGKTESMAQWGERSEKKPVNGERIRKIELYAVSWCPSCREARKWLAEQRVEYFDYDIEADTDADARHEALGTGGRIPALVVDGKLIKVGFSEKTYREAIFPERWPGKKKPASQREQPIR